MTASPVAVLWSLGRSVVVFGRMIRFSHSIFALPFALAGVIFAYRWSGVPVRGATWFWVAVAMVGARTAAMAFNRLADRHLDAANPRTANRELPRGVIGPATVAGLTLVASAVFLLAARMLNPLCFALAPVALAIVLGYSYTKRFTWACHFFLGLSLAVAPVGGWVAVTGRLDPLPFLLAFGVLAWSAGMDIIYALQDETFDRDHGVHSLPGRFGRRAALRVAAISHGAAVVALLALATRMSLSIWYPLGVGLGALLLLYQHRVVGPGDLRRISFAFFDLNGLFSVLYLGTAAAGVYLR